MSTETAPTEPRPEHVGPVDMGVIYDENGDEVLRDDVLSLQQDREQIVDSIYWSD